MSEHISVRTIDVAEIIDNQRVGRLQMLVIALCAATLFADGFDVQAMGYIAPPGTRLASRVPNDTGYGVRCCRMGAG